MDEIKKQFPESIFGCGKYGQTKSPDPYSGIVQAITDICNIIRQRGEFDSFRERLEVELGISDSMKMIDLIPALDDTEKLKLQNPDEDHNSSTMPPGPHAFRIFARRFRRFLEISCSQSRPLVLFLDDMQWTDENSRNLVRSIALDETSACLLVVCASRDDDGEPLFQQVDNNETIPRVSTCNVGNLSIAHVSQLLSDLLAIDEEEQARELATLLHFRTGGNCYFLIECIKSLQTEGCVHFDVNRLKWVWDMDSIRSTTHASSNIADLLIRKIETLPQDVQKLLMTASCLGFTLDADILEHVLFEVDLFDLETTPCKSTTDKQQQLRDRIQCALQVSISEGMIDQVGPPGRYRFLHDRVQQAALDKLSNKQGSSLLFVRIGYCLLNLKERGMQPFFSGIDLLNQHNALIEDNHERTRLAELNWEAGRQSLKSSAFVQAEKYFLEGIQFLNESRWVDHYDLTVKLSIACAELNHVNGKHDKCLVICNEIVEYARRLEHKLKALDLQVKVSFARLELAECSRLATIALKYLGMNLPIVCRRRHAAIEMYRARMLLKKVGREQKLALPFLADPNKQQSLRFLKVLALIALMRQETYVMQVARVRMVQIAVRSGWSPEGLYGVAVYACVLAVKGKVGEAHELASVCLEVVHTWPESAAKVAISMISTTIYAQLWHLNHPIHNTLEPLLYAYKVGMEIGNVDDAMLALNMHGSHSILAGMPLENLEIELRSSCIAFKEFSNFLCLSFTQLNLQYTLNLAGRSASPLVFTGEAMNEEEFCRRMLAAKASLVLSYFYSLRMMLHVILGSYETANQDRMQLPIAVRLDTYTTRFFIAFLGGLCCLSLARRYPEKRREYLRESRVYTVRISDYVKEGCINCVPMQNLLSAELKSLSKRKPSVQVVKSAYDIAIRDARRSGFPVIVAVAADRAADYFERNRHPDLCHDYLTLAAAEFLQYGALAKVAQMRQRYGEAFEEALETLEKRGQEPKRSSAKLRGFIHRSDSSAFRFDSSESVSMLGFGISSEFDA